MRTKKKKSKRSFTRKKRGGAHGLVLNIMYNKNNEIIDIQTQDILANKEYQELNKIDPTSGFMDSFKNFRDVLGSTHDFFHPFDTDQKKTKKRYVKIAVNDKRDIQLIQLTNQIIKIMNENKIKIKNPRPFVVVREKNKITKECQNDFKHNYEMLLRDRQDEILDKIQGGEEYKEAVKQMLRTPVLVNLISIMFGLLRRGDLKMEEIKKMFGSTDKLMEALSKIKSNRSNKNVVGYDQIVEEENNRLKNINAEKREELENLLKLSSGQSSSSSQPSFQSASSSSFSSQPSFQSASSSSFSSQPSFQPSSNASIANRKSISPQMSDDKIQEIIDDDNRLNPLFKFIDILNNTNTQTRNKFYDYVRNHQQTGNFRLELQKYLIEDIISHLQLRLDNFPTDHIRLESEEDQAVVLTMIRMILTSDMKDYPTFLQSFNDNYEDGNICQALKTASNYLSIFGILRSTFSYDTIINNIFGSCTSFSDIISIHLNKLYDMFKTQKPDYIKFMRLKAFKTPLQIIAPTIFYKEDDVDPNNPNFIFTRLAI